MYIYVLASELTCFTKSSATTDLLCLTCITSYAKRSQWTLDRRAAYRYRSYK